MSSKKKTVTTKPKKKRAPSSSTKRGGAKPWPFPKNPLEDAIRVARAIEDKNAGKPMRPDDLVRAVGFKKPADWRFQDLLRSSAQYGLTKGSGTRTAVALEQIGTDIVAPSSSQQRQKALVAAFRNVETFKEVEAFYSSKRIPEDEYFENTLVRDFGIDRDRVQKFIEVFRENVGYLNLFDARVVPDTESSEEPVAGDARPVPAETRVREFLDTCFVMMPFGQWFDRYYKEIYVHAIKEAGLEPVRADELFTTGSVVEQIWEEIRKAPVLLADLSDKNANVFYELGLAHATTKPVVFTANSLEHVPFDLRHLRVIIYDCREPGWDIKLGKQITEYVKAAKADPAKSIPQPFRDSLSDDSDAS